MGGCRCVWLVAALVSCKPPAISLENRQCDEQGNCVAGYVCHPTRNICVRPNADGSLPDVEGSGGGGGAVPDLKAVEGNGNARISFTAPDVCEVTTADGTLVFKTTGAGPVDHLIENLTNGTLYTYRVTCSGETSVVNVTPIGLATEVSAESGHDGKVVLHWTAPPGATSCIARRAGVDAGREETGLTNGTPYMYTVLCRSGPDYANPGVPVSATPIGIVRNLTSTVAGATVTLTYTRPAGAAACKLLRDGTQVGDESTQASVSVMEDVALEQAYHYAVLCRADNVYRNATEELGKNALDVVVGCVGTVTVTSKTRNNRDCARLEGADQVAGSLRVLASNCSATLDSLTLREMTASTLPLDVAFSELVVRVDRNHNGNVDLADAVVATGSIGPTSVTFDFPDFQLPAGGSGDLLIVGSVPNGVSGYMAFDIPNAQMFSVSPATRARVLSPSHVLLDAHAVGPQVQGYVGRVDRVPIASVISYESTYTGSFAADDPMNEANYCAIGANANRCDYVQATANASNQDTALPDERSIHTTNGANWRYLKIHTGIPLGLPICGAFLTMYASKSNVDASGCNSSGALFADNLVGLYQRYDGATSVIASDAFVHSTIVDSNASGCDWDAIDGDLLSLYNGPSSGASAVNELIVRVVATAATGGTGPMIIDVPEMDIRITPQ